MNELTVTRAFVGAVLANVLGAGIVYVLVQLYRRRELAR